MTLLDGSQFFINEHEENQDYITVLQWKDAGHEIQPAPAKAPPDNRESAYSARPIFEAPADDSAIWRYMSFEQFISFLLTESLWFSRGSTLRSMDPYEGQLPKENATIDPATLLSRLYKDQKFESSQIDQFSHTHRVLQGRFQNAALNNCWNLGDHESHAMWKVYGRGKNSVALRSTFSRLKSSFGPYSDYDVLIGKIRYIDYKVAELDESNYLNLYLHKAPFYSSENELRCIIVDDGDIPFFPDDEPIPLAYYGRELTFRPGAPVPVDLNGLFHEVVVGPEADPWFYDSVCGVLKKFGLDHISVVRSLVLTYV
ncbi:hypothetical protein RA280_16595 [Cupriavidus sp. CV2]|uniref:hypothetical protein n=1 Tax=Cupriavidus ulmosensis TaxID=3065913 RepID=UPI00296AE819|nr:hypothetical protein [Cupriavidus sp. CV2]MDW3683336.1 hypothetical protein [Cupriavidus sp. CV2]